MWFNVNLSNYFFKMTQSRIFFFAKKSITAMKKIKNYAIKKNNRLKNSPNFAREIRWLCKEDEEEHEKIRGRRIFSKRERRALSRISRGSWIFGTHWKIPSKTHQRFSRRFIDDLSNDRLIDIEIMFSELV